MAKGELSVTEIATLIEPGLYKDGNGLYLRVRSPTRRSWVFRYSKNGAAHWMGIGPALLPLKDARKKALELRLALLDGVDPLLAKAAARAEKAKADKARVSFRVAAERFISAHAQSWKSPKHKQQWTNTLSAYAYPVFGDVDVREIDTAQVLEVIEPLWAEKTATASRVRGRVEAVLDYAGSRHWRRGENPARWRGHLDNLLPKAAKAKKVVHRPALPWQRAGVFMMALRAEHSIAARALEFLILTASRSNEVIGARWPEVDLDAAVWIIPPARMKSGAEHRVPLPPRAMAILTDMLALRDEDAGDLVFPGARTGRPMSNTSLSTVLRDLPAPEGEPWVDPRQDGRPITVHGFRSAFRDWAGEATSYPGQIAEAALAHVINDQTRAAYERADKLEWRRRMMKAWAAFCARPAAEGKVKPIRTAAAAAEGS